ncbi:hypothetical protein F8M41_008602 [Gigaspora margarita]|uniref:Uncharacterized protein n=1 Tax=Gigaspora margarita TaxID=4874 RepID=A0A8H4A3J7_GIGMA|nr:hypothetical protein F8M41_008602 [Gigaspora margarita]
MHYFWAFSEDIDFKSSHLENFELGLTKDKDLLDIFEKWTSKRILPASSYSTIYKNLDITFGEEKKQQLFKAFLKDNIYEEFYLTCYGSILMDTFFIFKDDK